MTITEILHKYTIELKRYKTILIEGEYYTVYDVKLVTEPVNNMQYVIFKRLYLKLDVENKDFEVLDKDFFSKRKNITGRSSKYIFKISKKKIFDKLKEKYGDRYMEFIYDNVTTDIVKYVDEELNENNTLLIFDNKVYLSKPDKLLKSNNYMDRVYKLKTLKNKIK